jgi:hypothetical protein
MAAKDTAHIPVWFIHLTTAIMVGLIPWVVWISKQSIEMGVKQTYILERLAKIEEAQEK